MDKKTGKRVAYQPTGLVMREENDKPIIDGLAIVTNKETILYEGRDYREIEVIDPNAVRIDFIKTQDITLNLLHERELSFNRYPSGALTLELREDGLHFSAPGDDSAIARQATDLIKNGTYTGCSFEFWPKDYTVSERTASDGKTEYIIRHTEFEKIDAITIAMKPAYKQTSVNARELLERSKCKSEPNCDDCPLRDECGGKDKKECPPDKDEQCKAKNGREAAAKAEAEKREAAHQQMLQNNLTIRRIRIDADYNV